MDSKRPSRINIRRRRCKTVGLNIRTNSASTTSAYTWNHIPVCVSFRKTGSIQLSGRTDDALGSREWRGCWDKGELCTKFEEPIRSWFVKSNIPYRLFLLRSDQLNSMVRVPSPKRRVVCSNWRFRKRYDPLNRQGHIRRTETKTREREIKVWDVHNTCKGSQSVKKFRKKLTFSIKEP